MLSVAEAAAQNTQERHVIFLRNLGAWVHGS